MMLRRIAALLALGLAPPLVAEPIHFALQFQHQRFDLSATPARLETSGYRIHYGGMVSPRLGLDLLAGQQIGLTTAAAGELDLSGAHGGLRLYGRHTTGGPLALRYQSGYLYYTLENEGAALRWHQLWAGAGIEWWLDPGLALYGGGRFVTVEGRAGDETTPATDFSAEGTTAFAGIRFDYGSDGYVELELRSGQGRGFALRFGRIMEL